ncbi:cytochrome-c peroxidase [Halotia branconii]|uniref:Cytochrome c peroxidase n=1 Tax=Halotia branconii CENA392 TaxID=1539056 RepID=A0AAJ6NWS3_9CYAN|nr:cytochrome c peroxidase [Halotia branconii]WGV28168.1 cytochrome c peroxidase [Halotia branconii CENA392]
MKIILLISVLVLTSLPICLLLTSKNRFLLKFLTVQSQQALSSLADRFKLPSFKLQKSYKTTSSSTSSVKAVGKGLTKPQRLASRLSKSITIAVIVLVAIIAGNTVSAQVTGTAALASLKTVAVPKPDNLENFIKDKVATIKLGKALFWDMQVGSDGMNSCATCHFHAGADNRSKNQLAPGLLRINADGTDNPDTIFDLGGAPNYQLKPEDFPFHKLSNSNDPSTVVSDRNDVASSQGVFNSQFIDVIPGQAEDKVKLVPDSVFNVGGTNVRRVEPRNTPSMINAVFNFRNFWDGRAQNIFNGVNSFGLRDPNASVVKAETPSKLEFVKVSLNNSSLASQAVTPPLSSFESSADGRTFEEIGDKFGSIDKKSHSVAKGKKLPRKLAKKLLPLRPLGKQVVHPEDSVLGVYSRFPQPGLKNKTYDQLIQDAFKPEWWKSNQLIQVNADGVRSFVKKPDRNLETNEYTLMEYNFPLFFGLAVQMYESTLIADDTPFDRFMEGNTTALTQQQQKGKQLFEGKAQCTICHNGAELTSASVSAAQQQRIGILNIPNLRILFDNGFFNIGVRPTLEDIGVSGKDPFGNSLSETQLALLGTFKQLLGSDPNITVTSNDLIVKDGSFKTPGLRNVELTAPYFHNGGYLTLQQVVNFYNRGGDFRQQSALAPLGLTETEKDDLVAFLKGLTDERVRYEKAPFDHPQLFVPNGHPGSSTFVTNDSTGKATDSFVEIPAVGRSGSNGTPNFLENY